MQVLSNLLSRFSVHRKAARELAQMASFPPSKSDVSVLCLAKMQFTRDIEELRKRTQIDWVLLQSHLLKAAQLQWVPESLRLQRKFTMDQSPEAVAARADVKRFALFLLEDLKSRGPIHAVLSCNTDYWFDEGLRLACTETGIPFLALSREHDIVPEFVEFRIKETREHGFKFDGAGVAVFGEVTKGTVIEGGQCGPEKVTVTGAPRLDVWRDAPAEPVERKRLTFLTYAASSYMAMRNCAEAARVFARVSREIDPEKCEFFVKCKNEKHLDKLLYFIESEPGHRLRIEIDYPIVDLLRSSRFVMGFNSLAVLEALLSTAEIAIPHWGDAVRTPHELMVNPADPQVAPAFTFVQSPDDLASLLHRYANEEPLGPDMARRRDVLRQYFHYPEDRTCSELVEEWVRRHVNA